MLVVLSCKLAKVVRYLKKAMKCFTLEALRDKVHIVNTTSLMKESLVKPKTLSDAESAALPLTAITAWEGLFERLGIDYNKKDTNSFKTF